MSSTPLALLLALSVFTAGLLLSSKVHYRKGEAPRFVRDFNRQEGLTLNTHNASRYLAPRADDESFGARVEKCRFLMCLLNAQSNAAAIGIMEATT